MTPNDPLYAQQWHFALIGDIETIWDEFTGDGVQVGVFDDGIEINHPDLAANYDASLHFTFNGTTYVPTPLSGQDGHGTSCAGIIGAVEGNGQGGVGVAFGVTLTSVNIFDPRLSANNAIEEASMLWAANFDIMSNSWGWTPGYAGFQDIGDNGTNHDSYDEWFGQVVATGRGGLGTVIVQAAGNDTLNANGDGVNASRFTATISATDEAGFAQDYTNFGACILVAAPASAVTTDLSGNDGYNTSGDGDPLPTSYTSAFGGTSAATPTVAGVIALMLDANENLGWRDVQNILAYSASETGSGFGNATAGFEVGAWVTGNSTDWNGGGHAYHASYGYGMVDAFAAVRMAEAWLTMYGAAETSANEQARRVVYTGPDVAIADNASTEVSVTMNRDMDIESVYVTVEITHTFSSDLILSLVGPDGTEVAFFALEGGNSLMDGGFEYTFAIDALRGYSSQGEWSLRVTDTVAQDVGVIAWFELEFFGAAASNDDVYTFTDDFLTLAALETGRTLVTDTNGGTDWLNMAAVAGDIVADLNKGRGVAVDGDDWFAFDADAASFENFYAGDGADDITGNKAANEIWGARGDDRIKGEKGNDRLNGGQDDDRLTGGKGNDRFIFDDSFGNDQVRDFADNADTVMFDADLWNGNLTVAQVITQFASIVGGIVTFDFGDGDVVSFTGVTDINVFQDDITII